LPKGKNTLFLETLFPISDAHCLNMHSLAQVSYKLPMWLYASDQGQDIYVAPEPVTVVKVWEKGAEIGTRIPVKNIKTSFKIPIRL
jgi:hypothetical protein